jgi:outer membrane protein assembly factor BamB
VALPVGPDSSASSEWTFDANGAVSGVVVAGGTVYVAAGDTLHAVDAHTGEAVWGRELAGAVTTPAVVGGAVYATAGEFAYALDADGGDRVWRRDVTDRTVGAAPTVGNGTVYVAANQRGDQVYALDTVDGSTEWSADLAARDREEAFARRTLAVDNGRVYVAGASGGNGVTTLPVLFALDADTGERIWEGPDRVVVSYPTAAPTVSDDGAHLYTETATPGITVYETDTGTGGTRAVAVDSRNATAGPVAVAGGTVYLASGSRLAVNDRDEDNDRRVYALDPETGTSDWTAPTDGPVLAAPALAGDVLYAGVSPGLYDGTAVALDRATGERLWDYDVDGRIEAAPAVADGTVYVGTTDGRLYALSEGRSPPEADFTTDPPDPETGRPVTFDAAPSEDTAEAGGIDYYYWEFPDGTTATGRVANDTFDRPWVYDVTLTVVDDEGQTDTTTREVTVTPPVEELTANFTAEPTDPVAGRTVAFDGSLTTGEADVTRYEWSFGDGTEATGETVTHAFPAAGSHDVTLTVTDEVSATDATTRTVSVDPAPPRPAVSVEPERPGVGETVTLDASGTTDPDGSVESYEWSLGTGRSPPARPSRTATTTRGPTSPR